MAPALDPLPASRAGVPRAVLHAIETAEQARYARARPQSRQLADAAARHFLGGVPLHWMADWPTPFPLFVAAAEGATVTDADGLVYRDFCLGDTAAMFGHSPPAVARALAAQAGRGLTAMLPGTGSAWIGAELARRFGLGCWQLAATASDANRFLLRWARAVTGRAGLVVFDGCYHGAVDDTLVRRAGERTVLVSGLIGQVADPTSTTRVVDFNDLEALDAALRGRDVAAVLCEPAMTNTGMILPDPGYHRALRELTRHYGTLLLFDETHTLSTGPAGYSGAFGLESDGLVIGKAIAGGLPCAIYGVSATLAARMREAWQRAAPGRTGIGTTLSANLLQLAALRATLEEVMTDDAYAQMTTRASALATGLQNIIAAHGLPWCVTQLGARTELQFRPTRPRTAREAEGDFDPVLERTLHLFLLNRGVLISPFHNMILVSPATSDIDIAVLCDAFEDFVRTLSASAAQQPVRPH